MKRQNYKVLVQDKKQAKQYKQALLAIGERADSEYFTGDQAYPLELLFAKPLGTWAIGISNRIDSKRVTFKELLTLLVTQVDQPKSGLLDGKVAVQVNNEREFKLLMEHFYTLKWITDSEFNYLNIHGSPEYWSYNKNPYRPGKEILEEDDYKISPFATFAKEVGIKVPVFVMKSVDGVDLYEGDDAVLVWGKVSVLGKYGLTDTVIATNIAYTSMVFATKQAAESWIEEQNTPKSVKIELATEQYIEVFEDRFEFTLGIGSFTLTDKHIREMNTAHKSLLTA